MESYLCFQLYGPLSSWGEVAVGEERPTGLLPTRSALCGLIAACLGIGREERSRQTMLTEELCFFVLTVSTGEHLRDFHTAQAPDRKAVEAFMVQTRRDELYSASSIGELYTILSYRGYRSDAYYQVAVCQTSSSPEFPLKEIEESLRRPYFVPYLGRKSCPVSLPLAPRLNKAETALEALRNCSFQNKLQKLFPTSERLNDIFFSKEQLASWEDGIVSGISWQAKYSKRDKLKAGDFRLFEDRAEYQALLTSE